MPQSDELVPRLAEGVRLLGAYDSPGLTKPKFIAERPDGQVVLLSALLYVTATFLDGSPLDLVATKVSESSERPLNAVEVAYLAETKLLPLGLVVTTPQGLTEAPSAPKAAPILGMAGAALLPGKAVRVIAWCLHPLFWWPVIVVVLVFTVLADVWAFLTQPVLNSLGVMLLHPAYLLGAFGLLASATLFHEFGHAAACRYGGGKPGAIGAGVYMFFPAFYTDVTDSYRLSRRARIRVDLGGVYFNCLWIIGAAVVYRFHPYPPALVILAFSNLTIIQQLLPIVRLDGYWVLSDLVGVPDLFARIRPAFRSIRHWRKPTDLTWKATIIVTTWVIVIVPLLLGGMFLTIKRMPSFMESSYHLLLKYYSTATVSYDHRQWSALALAGVMMAFLCLPVAGFSIMFYRMGRTMGTVVVAKMPKRYRPEHMLREPPSFNEEEPYVMTLLRTPRQPLRMTRAYMPPRPLPYKRKPTEPGYWPAPKKLEWWEMTPEEEEAAHWDFIRRGFRPPPPKSMDLTPLYPEPDPQDSEAGPLK